MNAIAVLADEGHLDKTKQIIYSSYVYGNWDGEYILLAHEVKNKNALNWFTERGIHVVHIGETVNVNHHFPKETSIYYSTLHLFHPDLARWNTIIYLDTDMIVRKDISHLLSYDGFAAANDCARFPLIHQFSPRERKCTAEEYEQRKLQLSAYNLQQTAFNAGMMVIDSKNNSPKRHSELMTLAAQYNPISTYGDQGILNLYFQKNRQHIPYVYNDFYQSDDFNRQGIIRRFSDCNSVILHLTHPYKPWDKRSAYFREWARNNEKAEQLFDAQQKGKKPSVWGTAWIEWVNDYNVRRLQM